MATGHGARPMQITDAATDRREQSAGSAIVALGGSGKTTVAVASSQAAIPSSGRLAYLTLAIPNYSPSANACKSPEIRLHSPMGRNGWIQNRLHFIDPR